MREILFRGKRTDNGEWVHGYYVAANHNWHNRGVHKDWIVTAACANGGWFALHGRHPVVADTVGQYTGIKDKNGTMIFDGDVVKIGVSYGEGYNSRSVTGVIAYDDMGYLGVIVEYYDGRPVWSDIICELDLSGAIEDYCFEVIGNVHDNPELMEVGHAAD